MACAPGLVKLMKIANTLQKILHYILRRVLVYDLILIVIAALTFIFTGGLTPLAFSERIFWVGLFVFVLAGMMVLSYIVPSRFLLFPYNIRKPEDAKKFVDETPEVFKEKEKRLDVGIQIWLIGAVCLAVAAIIQSVLAG